MPAILAAVLAYVAGLLLGFGGLFAQSCALAVAIGGLAWWGGRRREVALAALVVAGAVVAADARRRDARCANDLARAPVRRVELDGAAAPGTLARGRVHGASCRAIVSMLVVAGRAPAGAVVLVAGDGVRSRRGVLVRAATVRVVRRPSALRRARALSVAAVDRVFRRDAALARTLLLADVTQLAPEVRDRFAAAGLAHVLSVSGLHVAILAGAVALLLGIARVPAARAAGWSVAIIVGYVALIGAPPPAVRSASMLAVLALSARVQRPTSPWAVLALGAAIPLHDPRTAMDVGWQLSVTGMAALVASRSLARRWLAPHVGGWRLTLGRDIAASTLATIVTAPLAAWTFGRVSLLAPLTNLVATPIVALLQPMLFLALLLAPLAPAALLVADAAHPLLVALDRVAAAGAAIPHGVLDLSPTPVAAMLAATVTIGLLVACVARWPARPAAAAMTALAGLVWLPLLPAPARDAELHVIDVGQGDAIALRTPRGRWIVVDAGRVWRGGDAGRSQVVPYLRRRGGDVAAFVLSHPHADHVGGAASVMRALRPSVYFDPGFAGATPAYRASLLAAQERSVAWRRVRPGDSVVIDDVTLRFLAPESTWVAGLRDPNEASTVVLARYGAVRFLLVGDAERSEEAWLLARWAAALRADVLKVAHHGSATSTTAPFLAAVAPRVALVSVGADNRYGHPSPAVLGALVASGASVLRTDHLGTLVARTDGRRLTLDAAGDTWESSLASPRP